MKFGIDIGHNCPIESGASGIKREDNLTMEVGFKVIAKPNLRLSLTERYCILPYSLFPVLKNKYQ